MDIKCKNCQKEVKNVTKRRQFCSQKCIHKFSYIPHPCLLTGIYKNCDYCGELKYVKHCRNHFKKIFCSRKHQTLFLKQKAFNLKCITCGKTFYCQPCQIKYRNRKNCSRFCYGKMRTLKAEERHKNGFFNEDQLNRMARYSKKAQKWREAIFKRDNYTCQTCGIRGAYLEADHIKPWAFFPKLRFVLSNGRTLCRKCHDKTKIGYKKMREMYAKNLVI